MTVGELIAKLQEYDPSLPVALLSSGPVIEVFPDRLYGRGLEPEPCVALASREDLEWLEEVDD